MVKNKVAVIQFPGSNCDVETQEALTYVGLSAEIVRWNADAADLKSFQAFVLPGGFSYQDRVRAGAIAAKLPVMSTVIAAANAGAPVLGICNGCQILAESGLVPDFSGDNRLEIALAPNAINSQKIGHVCDWVNVSVRNPEKNIFTRRLTTEAVLPVPVNHGEGRFVFGDIEEKNLENVTRFIYVEKDGTPATSFPAIPNGSQWGVAGIGNKHSNVFALMPHPERALFIKQIPLSLNNDWAIKKHAGNPSHLPGPWKPFFAALKEHLEGVNA